MLDVYTATRNASSLVGHEMSENMVLNDQRTWAPRGRTFMVTGPVFGYVHDDRALRKRQRRHGCLNLWGAGAVRALVNCFL